MSERLELKPCPICGSGFVMQEDDRAVVFCADCGWQIREEEAGYAAKQWNYLSGLADDSEQLDKLIASGRLRYAVAADRQVGLSHRRAVDEVLKHADKRGDLQEGWWEELEATTEEVFWRERLS